MWIRNEEDLRAHLEDPASREGNAFEYKGAIGTNPKKGTMSGGTFSLIPVP